jgi:hypothetical protein
MFVLAPHAEKRTNTQLKQSKEKNDRKNIFPHLFLQKVLAWIF